MKRKGFKLAVGLLMAAFFMLFAGSAIVYAADGVDTRTHIDRGEFTTNIKDVFYYGGTTSPDLIFTQTSGETVEGSSYYDENYYGQREYCIRTHFR